MSRFQRMIVIPEEEYNHLVNFKQPLRQQFLQAVRQHETDGMIKDPYSKLVHQGLSLESMKLKKDKMRTNVSKSTPKHFRARANQLLNAIESHIDFNDRGEILKDNQPISGSHIEDLIQYAVRDNRRITHPPGWTYFLEKLRLINVPRISLNRDTINELQSFKQVTNVLGKKGKLQSLKRSISFDEGDEDVESLFVDYPSKARRLRTASRRYPKSEFINY